MAKKEKKPKKEKPVKEPGEKKGFPVKLILILVIVLALLAAAGTAVYFLFLRGDSAESDEPEEVNKAPAVYAVGLDEVVSLDSVMDEGAAMLTTVEAPTRAALDVGYDEKTYRYKQAEDPKALALLYIDVLRGEEQGFVLVDAENQMLAEEPDLDRTTGSVYLAKAAVAEEEGADPVTFRVVVVWSEYAIAIQVAHKDGAILPAPEPEPEPDGEVSNVSEQIEFFENLSPSVLGLPGAEMSEYRLYPMDGWVMVNGYMCRQVNVYLLDMPSETNSLLGMYYISDDMKHLFSRDRDLGFSEVELP